MLDGLSEVFANGLGVASLKQKSEFLTLCQRKRLARGPIELLAELWSKFDANWSVSVCPKEGKPSKQNWRWFAPQVTIAPKNKSPEVTLERAFIQASVETSRSDWSNQIPVASGLTSSSSKLKRMAIDLAQLPDPYCFRIVELKIGSDTPIYAAFELIIYSLFWLRSRIDRAKLGYEDRCVLSANKLYLDVLAPSAYYADQDIDWLAKLLSTGLKPLFAAQGVHVQFAYRSFLPEFRWPYAYPDATLLQIFDDIFESE